MFAVLMIVLNAAVGLCLLLGGLRHHAQAYNLQGAVAYLAVIIPLSAIALILPDFTHVVPVGSLTLTQAASSRSLPFYSTGYFLRSRQDAIAISSWSWTLTERKRLPP